MKYKVVIPTAGTGSRLGGITKYINKSLVSLGGKPTISRIIESFPEDTEFVIAIGYKGELVKEYLRLAYPDKKFQIVDVFPYEGEGSGLGLSILKCKDYLQEPFIFCSCDTLVNEKIPLPCENWMGYDNRDNKEQYRTVSIEQENVNSIDEKGVGKSHNNHPYIGLAGIYDYKLFWNAMETGGTTSINVGESFGLRSILENGKSIKAKKFTWFDTGIKVELEATKKRFNNPDGPNILDKENETIWFLNDKVIKYSDNEKFISDRVDRAKLLKGFVPPIIDYTKHMYSYKYVNGDVMSKCVTLPLFKQLLDSSKKFWKLSKLNDKEKQEFIDACLKFYKEKTYKRVKQFFETFKREDKATIINGKPYPSAIDLLDRVDWNYIANGLPGQFHGDFHFENILYNKENNSFEFLDWRQNFGNSLIVGDIYYDLGKMLHGLIMCHELVAKEEYNIVWDNENITYDFNRKQILVNCENYYYDWLKKNGYDEKKVKFMSALIFLNIAALHHYPYSLVLMALGKEMLNSCLENINV